MPKLAVTEGPGRRVPILARVTPAVRESLEASAGTSGRSLSLEIETRLQMSFDLEEQLALQDEIKAEMRGTIASLDVTVAALERQVVLMKEREALLWPDEEAHALGKMFSKTLDAVRHFTGKGWRENPAAPAIVAEVVRRAMVATSRGPGLFEGLFNSEKVAAVVDHLAPVVTGALREKLPPLPAPDVDRPPPTRVRTVHVFKDKATGRVLETFTSRDFDLLDPADRPALEPDYLAALERYRPRRDEIDVDTVFAPVEKPGMAVWQATPEEVAAFKPARTVLPPEIGDRALFDETMAPPRPDDGDAPQPAPGKPSAPVPARTRRARAKV